MNTPSQIDNLKDRIENDFTYHPPTEEQQVRYRALREKTKDLALFIIDSTPMSREQSIALTKLEEVIFFANASIVRNEKGK